MDLTEGFLEQEAGDARAGVDGREDEERLEHDGEVIPVFHDAFDRQAGPMKGVREDKRHSHCQCHSTARAATERFAANHTLNAGQVHGQMLRRVNVGHVQPVSTFGDADRGVQAIQIALIFGHFGQAGIDVVIKILRQRRCCEQRHDAD